MEKKKILTIRRIFVIIFLIIFTIIGYINFRGSCLEYQELGENFLHTYLKKQKFFYLIMITNMVFIFILTYFVGRKIKRGLKVFFDEEKKEMPKLPNKSIAIVFSIVESIFIAIKFTPIVILCVSNTSFGENVPIFNLDISFFMFVMPLIKMLLRYFIKICVGIIIYTFVYYVIVFNKFFDGIEKETLLKSEAMKTLFRTGWAILIGISMYILICSMDIVYDNFLTTDNNIKLAGAGVIDSTIKYWGYNILAFVLSISAFKAINNLKNGNQIKVLKSISIVPIYLVLLFVVMLTVDFIFVRPNRFDKEKSYIEFNMASTKKAYGIECENQNINYTGTIGAEEVQKNSNIINNTAIINKEIVLSYLKENQTGKGYYTYRTAKLSKLLVDGKNELVYISPREIVNNRRTYNSKTYEYTHGYGVIFTYANRFNEAGKIIYLQSDLNNNEAKIKINTPQIYYGLETNSYVITNAKNKKEFDYLDEGKEYEANYSGTSGLKLNFIDRLIMGIKQHNIKMAVSTDVTNNSNLLINRNILKRAKLGLSDIVYDEEPYAVINNEGEIYWVIDGYTLSSSYPYSTYTEIEYNGQKKAINYIRNSIKVIINAYNGKIKYYITDRTDPIAMAYRNIYPEIFEDLNNEIPEDIKSQFIYPKLLYDVQSTMLEEYHNTKADVLYRSDDTWEKTKYKNLQNSKRKNNILDAYYTIIENEEIGLIQMYSPKGKQNINAYLIGTVENGINKLKLKTLQSDTNIMGPVQLDTQLSQDKNIKEEIDNLTVTGAKVTKDMIIIPIDNTFLYIEPIYQTLLNENDLPVLKKVIVASGNKVAIGDDLLQAIQNLISKSAASIEVENIDEMEGLIDSIIKTNDNLTNSINTNNWELIGTDIKKLQELINLLKKQNQDKAEDNKNMINIKEKE